MGALKVGLLQSVGSMSGGREDGFRGVAGECVAVCTRLVRCRGVGVERFFIGVFTVAEVGWLRGCGCWF